MVVARYAAGDTKRGIQRIAERAIAGRAIAAALTVWLFGVLGIGVLSGCVAQDDGHAPRAYPSAGASAGSSASAPTQPLLVDVDANQTLETQPGNGLGVYVEYETGGHWLVWWTCDTNRTGDACHYQINASVAEGAITNVAGQNLEGNDSVTQPNAQSVSATTTTTGGADGVLFDTTAGEAVMVSVTVDADVFFFFVQDKQVNGGYQGALTNPLLFQPSTP